MSEYIVPALVDEKIVKQIQEQALVAFKALRCSGYGRFDLRLTDEGEAFFLEFNTLPGMTATSLVPKAAKAIGMNFNALLEKIIEIGRDR